MWGVSYGTASVCLSSFIAAEHDLQVLLCDFGCDVHVL